MSKIHYHDEIKNSVWKSPYSARLWTVCKLEIYRDNVTNDPDKTTCKNCIRVMGKKEK